MKHIITTVFVFVSYILSAQVKISDLPAAGTVAGTEVFPIVQSAATKKLPIDSVRFWKQNGSGEIYRISDVGIGTNNPAFKLDVEGDTSALRVISDNTTLEISNNLLGTGISGAGVSYMHDASKNFSLILGDIGGEPAGQLTYNNDTADIGVVVSMESVSMIATDTAGNPFAIVEARDPEGVQIAGVDSGSVNNSLTVRKGNDTFLAGSPSFIVRNDGQVTITDLAGSGTRVVTADATGVLGTDSAGSENILGYKVYTALLTQTGTNAPVATVLENTLGGTVVWSYDAVGQYTLTATGLLTVNKVFVQLNGINQFDGIGTSSTILTYSLPNSISFISFSGDGSALEWSSLSSTDVFSIEIRVYP